MYTKQDAKMTQGLAILSMLILHLFCRTGVDVFGRPLLWFNETTPFVYWFGFFAEICVPLYSLVIGYAQELLFEEGGSSWRHRWKRLLKLMLNYWVVVILFSFIGLIKHDPAIPGSIGDFIKTLFLLHSYNGAWWFLHSYVLMLIISPKLLLFPVHRMKPIAGGGICAAIILVWYLLGRFGLRLGEHMTNPALKYVIIEIENLVTILPYVWIGGILCRCKLFDKVYAKLNQRTPGARKQKLILLMISAVLFVVCNFIHKSVLMPFVAAIVFVVFNLWKKSERTCRLFSFLGEHSTNIWLTHMFFYLVLFPGLVQSLRYPVLMLVGLLFFSILASYAIKGILKIWDKLVCYVHNTEA